MSERVMEDDIDIYGDLDNIKDEEKIDPALVKELNEKNAVLEGKVEELSTDLDKLRKYCGSLEANISSLHKTARVEIERKDRMISELRQQIDNAAFRRDNFRIPKRINKPVKFPPPPKDDSYYPETVKKEVNGTINREETTYASPLNDEADDTEQIYQPEKVPVTLFGERLRKRLQREAEEEAEAAKALAEQNEASEPKKSAEDVDKENQYRLIPLDLKDNSENSRRRGSENSEQEEPKLPEASDRRRQKENHDDYPNHDNKRRKFGDNESRREKSPVDRHKNSRRSEERRRLEHEEYICPPKGVNDEISVKRRHRDNQTNRSTSSGRKSRNNGSDSRSKSRERRERREESRDSHAERRKNGRMSRSPNRRHENGKLGKRDTKVMEERVERTREKLRNSKRLRGRDASPSGSRLDLRQRLGRRSASIVQRRINTRSELRRETRRSERREKIGEGAKDKGKGRSSSEKGKDEKHEGRDREKRKRSRSCSSEKNERESKKVNGGVDVVHEDTMDALDCLEEGEIRDSPGAPLIFIPGYRSDDDKPGEISHVETCVNKLDVIIDKNCLDDTLDDSIKEEKIENIEKFIMKMQKKDEETEVNRIEVNLKEVSSTVDEKIEALDGETKTIMINNEAVPYNSVLSKYVKKKRDSTEKILEREEINESSSVIEKIESINSVDKTDVCASVKNDDAPKIADNNVTKNNINTGNKIDNGDSKEKTEIISVAEKCNLDEIDDKIVGFNLEEKTSNRENDSLKCLTKEEIEENNDELKINSGEVNQNVVESDRAKENGEVDEKEEELQSNDAKLEEKPKFPKEEIIEASKIPSKSSEAPSRMILQQIASPTKTQSKQVDNPLQKLEPKEKENSVRSSTALPNRIVVVARRRKVRLTDSSTSMTVVMSAKKTPVP